MVLQPGSTGTWNVFGPDGSIIPTTGTTTAGLQEAINYATTYGYNLHVIGGPGVGSPGTSYGLIFCSSPILWPPLRAITVVMEGVHIIFTSAVTGTGMSFDSMDECDINIVGEIVYQGNGSAVAFAPRTPVPVDGGIFIDASRVHISAVVTNGGSPMSCISFNPTFSSISFLDFSCDEVNGAGAQNQGAVGLFGVEVINPQPNTSFEQNIIKLGHVHEVVDAGVQIGTTTTNQQNMRHNIWTIGSIKPSGAGNCSGFNTFGSGDIVTIGGITNEEGALNYGVVVQNNAFYNTITVGQVVGASIANLSDHGVGTITPSTQTLRGTNISTGNVTVTYLPDGRIIQTVNNAGSSPTGVFTAFPVGFPNQCDSCVATPTNQVAAFSVSAGGGGFTITSASGTPNFNVIATGR
jgi:hypothetical protein